MIFVYGGSGSGKSEYAEDRIMMASENGERRYYIATMSPYGEENQKRISRHKKLRAGKGFITIEQPTDIENALESITEGKDDNPPILLECVSNLIANEMFAGCEMVSKTEVFDKIKKGLDKLINFPGNLVIVSNNVYEDGIVYDDSTTEYLKALSLINAYIAGRADEVIEVVAGIPVVVK